MPMQASDLARRLAQGPAVFPDRNGLRAARHAVDRRKVAVLATQRNIQALRGQCRRSTTGHPVVFCQDGINGVVVGGECGVSVGALINRDTALALPPGAA